MKLGDLGRTQTEDPSEVAIRVESLDLYYGEAQALRKINMNIPKKRVTAFIGPSGCGKSTLLRCFNRLNDLIDIVHVDGRILMDDKNIYDHDVNVALLRRRVGMV
ncbi:MAG: ATP-binding cassette domain-containing protein, partial [Gammaproteobacteria bacterium]|nr:ATP-binding cassette domain-containing protein [Gammaproteobacteria bacterium]